MTKLNKTNVSMSLTKENTLVAYDTIVNSRGDMQLLLSEVKMYNCYESVGGYLSALVYCYNHERISIGADDVLKVVNAAIEAHKDEDWLPGLVEELRYEIKRITGEDIGENV